MFSFRAHDFYLISISVGAVCRISLIVSFVIRIQTNPAIRQISSIHNHASVWLSLLCLPLATNVYYMHYACLRDACCLNMHRERHLAAGAAIFSSVKFCSISILCCATHIGRPNDRDTDRREGYEGPMPNNIRDRNDVVKRRKSFVFLCK